MSLGNSRPRVDYVFPCHKNNNNKNKKNPKKNLPRGRVLEVWNLAPRHNSQNYHQGTNVKVALYPYDICPGNICPFTLSKSRNQGNYKKLTFLPPKPSSLWLK